VPGRLLHSSVRSDFANEEIEVAAGVEGHNRLKVCRTGAGLKPMAENDAIGATSPENGSFADAAFSIKHFPARAFWLDSKFSFCSYPAPSPMGSNHAQSRNCRRPAFTTVLGRGRREVG
jgi:hypothetical protein